jgi:hypothetical protein
MIMSTLQISNRRIALAAILLGTSLAAGAATAGSLPSAKAAATIHGALGDVQPVRHRGWRGGPGIGIYIGPSYGYYPRYRYYDDDYYPRRSYYYYDDGYRPYRKHSRRWVRERFEHPLGRR